MSEPKAGNPDMADDEVCGTCGGAPRFGPGWPDCSDCGGSGRISRDPIPADAVAYRWRFIGYENWNYANCRDADLDATMRIECEPLYLHPAPGAGDTEPGDLVEPALWLCSAPAGVVSSGRSEASRENVQSYRDRGYTCEPYFSEAALSSLRTERDESDRRAGETAREIEKIRHERDRLIELRGAKPTGTREQRERQMLKRTEAAEASLAAEKQRVAELETVIADCATACGALVLPEASIEFKRLLPGEISAKIARTKSESEQRVAALTGVPK